MIWMRVAVLVCQQELGPEAPKDADELGTRLIVCKDVAVRQAKIFPKVEF
jgi:hypothetical protein